VEAKVSFDQKAGEVKFSLDLQGNTELEHELLAAAIGKGRRIVILPAHVGDELFAEFMIDDETIWPNAMRALENRIRVRDGRPTIEEEEAQAAMREAAQKDADAKATEAKAVADREEEDKKTAEDKRLADAVAAGISQGLAQAKNAPATVTTAQPAPKTDAPKS
jgi:hypothetical protein